MQSGATIVEQELAGSDEVDSPVSDVIDCPDLDGVESLVLDDVDLSNLDEVESVGVAESVGGLGVGFGLG